MHFFRRARTLRFFPWLLAAIVLLRSFIAPGYMFSVSAEAGLGIIFCNGPVSIYSEHERHAAHHHGDDHANQGGVHISPVCSDWSISSLLVFAPIFEPVLFDATLSDISVAYNTPFFQQYSVSPREIRGPPLLV